MNESPRCSQHPRDRAGWVCSGCNLELCLRCAARRKAGTGYVVVCLQCGGYAQAIMVPRARTSVTGAIADAFVYPFSRNGFLMMVAFGAVLSALELLGLLGGMVALGLLVSYLFLVVRASSTGSPDLPEAEDLSDLNTLGVSLGKALLVFLTGLAPFLVYAYRFRTGSGSLWSDPVACLTLAIAGLWIPVALLLAAVNSPMATVLNPLVAAQCVKRLGADYYTCAGVVWAAIIGWIFMRGTAALFIDVFSSIPLIPRVIGSSMTMYPAIVGGRMLGMLLFVRGADLNYGTSQDYLEPALGGLLPPEEKQSAPPATPATGSQQPDALAAMLNTPSGDGSSRGIQPPPAAKPPPAASRPPAARPSATSAASPARTPPPVAPTPIASRSPTAESSPPGSIPPRVTNWGTLPTTTPAASEPVPPEPPSSPLADEAFLIQAILGPTGEAPAATPTDKTIIATDLPDLPPIPASSSPALPPVPPPKPAAPKPSAESRTVAVSVPTDDEILKLAAAKQYDALANAYRARRGAVTVLSAEQLVQVAQLAKMRSDLQTASHAFKRVGFDHPKSPEAPRALLAAAQIFRELKKDQEGTKLLNHLVASYPSTKEAAEARALLGRAA